MSDSPSPIERRAVPAVAIIGNDAVLAVAPATPVQLAHACLQHGFSVAVPASWGDELVAAETVRRLVSRGRGPAVMCVCPFVRSRLLAPGPDLAPFLVSLVAPPVAAARYVRAAYGEHGVHITYIGSCPSADDPAIDVRLTPDAFLADIAERGIALSEQPLVFDSVVPPDRRRWCSVPGGVPGPDVLWNEADARTLVEIDPDDVSTDLAQHIITREHALLDLAPGLGCACSGAIAGVPPRSARMAVTALEPPRALGPVIDPASVIPLDAPVGVVSASRTGGGRTVPNDEPPFTPDRPGAAVAEILDLEIGRPVWNELAAGAVESAPASTAEATIGLPPLAAPPPALVEPHFTVESGVQAPQWAGRPHDHRVAEMEATQVAKNQAPVEPQMDAGAGGSIALESVAPSSADAADPAVMAPFGGDRGEIAVDADRAIVAESDIETLVESPFDSATDESSESLVGEEALLVESLPLSAASEGGVRRRTPVSVPQRPSAASIPRTTAPGGRSLPRAYVAKRRPTPSGGTAVQEVLAPATPVAPREPTPPAAARPTSEVVSSSPERGHTAPPLESRTESPRRDESSPPTPSQPAPSAAGSTRPPAAGAAAAPDPQPATPSSPSRQSEPSRRSAPASSGGQRPTLVVLVIALVALAAFVVWTLRR